MRALVRLLLLLLLVGAPGTRALAGARCDGCGMYLAPYAKTAHRLVPAQGPVKEFCSFSCLAEALARAPGQDAAVQVADYATGVFVDARAAAYVEGSDAPPVMDAVSVVGFGTPAAAAAFRSAHGGAVVSFADALAHHRARNTAAATAGSPGAQTPRPVFEPIPGQGSKVRLDAGRSFVFSFDKKPTMGTVIAKVEIFAADGSKDTSFQIKGNADMPTMGCQAGKPDRPFVLSRKGDYLLPYTFGMPGGWEVYLTFVKDGAVVFRGKYAFEL
jgi:nitrous oxide reductase accessory protein NosL